MRGEWSRGGKGQCTALAVSWVTLRMDRRLMVFAGSLVATLQIYIYFGLLFGIRVFLIIEFSQPAVTNGRLSGKTPFKDIPQDECIMF